MDKLEELSKEIKNFVDERDWNQFHSPANLSKSISIEANELLECFQWDEKNYNLDDVKEELADVINYCIQMAQVLNLDIYQIVKDKLEKTKKKYPEFARIIDDYFNMFGYATHRVKTPNRDGRPHWKESLRPPSWDSCTPRPIPHDALP